MSDSDDCADTREKIMDATYSALCEHGYANLTMQDIADEFEKSKSLIHYHYDTKQDLLTAFLDYLIEKSRERVASMEEENPEDRLRIIVDRLLKEHGDYKEDEDDTWNFQTAMLELRSQAPYLDSYREQLQRNDEYVHGLVADTIEDGIEKGVFHDVDPDKTAALILAASDGAVTRRITVGKEDSTEIVREAVLEHIFDDLLKTTDKDEDEVKNAR